MKYKILLLVLISFLNLKCGNSSSSYEIGISDIHWKTFFRNKHCNSDYYRNIIIRNDSLYVDGEINNDYGNYSGILNADETKILVDLTQKLNPKNREEKEVNPTTGITALIIKKNGQTIDSLVDSKIEWNQADTELFNYIGKLICEKELVKINDSIIYPTWIMIRPTE